MSSGMARTRDWVLEFIGKGDRKIDPLMGWTGSDDTDQQVRLTFRSRNLAIAYARRHGLDYTVREPGAPARQGKSYSANFSYTRKGQWTH